MKNRKDIGLLVARIIVGGIFIMAGWAKVSDMAGTIGYFGQMVLAPFWAYVVGYVELVGGVLVLLGLWTCLASSVLAIVMIVAAYLSRSMGFAGMMGPIAVLASLVVLATSCGGKYSVASCKCCSKCDAPSA
jgi:putative oxidoreductase